MHQREICLCCDCIRLATTADDEREKERAARGRAWFEASKCTHGGALERVGHGVVRRKRAA